MESEASRIFESDGHPFTESVMECSDEDSDSLPDLMSALDSSSESSVDEGDEVKDGGFELTYVDDVIIDKGGKIEILTFTMAMLANAEVSLNHKTELYDSGVSWHMSPYQNKFLNFISIKPKTIRAADGQVFEVIRVCNIHIELPNGWSTLWILLKDVLYAPAMGLTFVSISKIAKSGFMIVFHKNILKIMGPQNSILGTIDV